MDESDDGRYRRMMIETLQADYPDLDWTRLKLKNMPWEIFFEIPSDGDWTGHIYQVSRQVIDSRNNSSDLGEPRIMSYG
jgi:hypothetical protein